MSVDIFSLRALENISLSLENWQKLINRGFEDNKEQDELPIQHYEWRLRFIGYVTQQYTAKKNAEGVARPVSAYERISKRIPDLVSQHFLANQEGALPIQSYALGTVPTLHSLVPMAQTARAPIFGLGAKDGVVGAHFLKVKETKDTFKKIADKFLANIERLSAVQ